MAVVDTIVAQALVDLQSADLAQRRSAAKALFKQARLEHTGARRDALGRPEVVDALRMALEESDPTVLEQATGALGMIFTRYYRDERAYPALVRLTKSPRKLTRLWAATAVARLDRPDRWAILKPLLADKNPEVKQQVCRMIIDGCMASALTTEDKNALKPGIEVLTADPDPGVRTLAQNALGAVNIV